MSRVPPTPVFVLVEGEWIRGVVRTCEVSPDGKTCSSVVSYGPAESVTTRRFDPTQMRKLNGEPGCPIASIDAAD